MEESLVPSLSSGVVGSRFVTQVEIESAKARREEQWKAAYARLGQEPPPPQQEDSYDGRSLAEKLAANKIAKQEAWEEKNKLANQFRALEEDEIMFLDSIRERQEQEERLRKERDGLEVKNFKEAVAARTSAANTASLSVSASASSIAAKPKPATAKKDVKKVLKGVVVKKKPKRVTSDGASIPAIDSQKDEGRESSKSDGAPDAKRRKIGS